MDTDTLNTGAETQSFTKQIGKSFVINTAGSAGVMAGFLLFGSVYNRFKRSSKDTPETNVVTDLK